MVAINPEHLIPPFAARIAQDEVDILNAWSICALISLWKAPVSRFQPPVEVRMSDSVCRGMPRGLVKG